MLEIYKEILDADIIVFVSPVYFYTWTFLIKSTLDRLFALESIITDKKFGLISAGAAPEEKYMKTMFDSYHQYILCFRGEGNKNGGIIMAYGTNSPGDVRNSKYIQMAYDLGNSI